MRRSTTTRARTSVATSTRTPSRYFATLKRGINGVYHHVSEAQLPCHLSEFDFRYNTREMSDGRRTLEALTQAEGKSLIFRDVR